MLDKSENFQERLGTLVDGIKFVQGNNAYAPNGNFLGVIKEGKIAPINKPTPKDDPIVNDDDVDLELLDRPKLVAMAFKLFGVKLKGNNSKKKLIAQIHDLASK